MVDEKFESFNVEVEDSENYMGSKDMSKTQLIFRSLQKCMDEGAKEMSGGGVITRTIDGFKHKFPTVNQREVFINSIKSFWSLILPTILRSYTDLCQEELGDWTGVHNKINNDFQKERIIIKENFKTHKNTSLLNADLDELQSMKEKAELELYRAKLDFGILIIEKENWFGDRSV